jgi:oligopeptide transport system substrate-binding protein
MLFRKLLNALGSLILLSLVVSCSSPISSSDKTFRLALHSEPPTLDWSLATDHVSFDVLTNLMEGLTQYNHKMEPIPAIAERWEFSQDGKTITFFLRDDVRWTDGKAVTAMDFEYSWKRLLNPATAAEYAYFLFDIENAFEYNSGKIKDPDLLGIEVVSSTVLRVKLKRPVYYFPSIATFMVTFPQRKDLIEKYGDHWTDPEYIATTGPFALEEWRHEYKLIFKANPKYYGKPPGVERIVAYIVEEDTTALTLYETGELDMTLLSPVSIPYYRNSLEYRTLPLLRGYYYGFTVTEKPFDNPLVRRAFAHSIDRSQLPDILQGGEVPVSSWIPVGLLGYNSEIGAKFNPEKARSLLTEAGFPKGKGLAPITLAYNTNQTHRLVAEYIQDQWRRHLNVKVEIESQEWKVFLSRLKTDSPQIFRLGWGADFPDPDNFMNLFLSSSGNNHLNWSHLEYDRLVDRAALEKDPSIRKELYDRAQKILTESEAVIIPLFVTAKNLLVKPYIMGLELNALDQVFWKRISFLDSVG